MKFFKNYLNNKLKNILKEFNFKSAMLEIGCGTGETLEQLKSYKTEGIDASAEAIRRCKEKGISARKQDFLKNRRKYNSIICIDVLEHIKNDSVFIRQINKSLKNKGKALILVPSGKMMKDDIKYGHYRRYSKKEIIEKMEKEGFEIEHVEMFGYPFFHYLRIFMNYLTYMKINKRENLGENTEKSSYESPFDASLLSKIADFLDKRKIFQKILSMQDLFLNGEKGLGVLLVIKKEKNI